MPSTEKDLPVVFQRRSSIILTAANEVQLAAYKGDMARFYAHIVDDPCCIGVVQYAAEGGQVEFLQKFFSMFENQVFFYF